MLCGATALLCPLYVVSRPRPSIMTATPLSTADLPPSRGGEGTIVFLDRLDLDNFARDLDLLKTQGAVRKWKSTNLEIAVRTETSDVQLAARPSFPECRDYYGQLLSNAQRAASAESPFTSAFVAVFAACLVSAGVVVPQLPVPDGMRNVLGLFCIAAPFLLLLASEALPSLTRSIEQAATRAVTPQQSERILYHEAGHLLAGYLCGVPLVGYNLRGDIDSVTTIDTRGCSTANLLIVCMAGVVAESLQFGLPGNNNKNTAGKQAAASSFGGGAADIRLAGQIMQADPALLTQATRPQTNASRSTPPSSPTQPLMDGALRWAVLKALTLLRLYRRELDVTAELMRQGAGVGEIIQAIEAIPPL